LAPSGILALSLAISSSGWSGPEAAKSATTTVERASISRARTSAASFEQDVSRAEPGARPGASHQESRPRNRKGPITATSPVKEALEAGALARPASVVNEGRKEGAKRLTE
jgi:hypothetical protein